MNSNIYCLLAFIIGIGLSVQTGLNSQLRAALGSPIMAALASFLVGSFALMMYAFIFQRQQSIDCLINAKGIPYYKWVGGLLGACYVAGVILVAPRIGMANTTALIVAGQLLFALILDHFGLLGFMQHSFSVLRLLGVCFLVVGVTLILRN